MNIEDLIPDRVFLSPLSRCLTIADIDIIDEDGNIIPKADRGYSWVVTEKDPGRCNPEFVNIQRLWHKPSEKPKPLRKGMQSIGCLIRFKSGAFEYGEYWFGQFNRWQDPFVAEEIKLEDIESWCYINDLLPKGGSDGNENHN